jgi:acetamidase/formamidase/AraC-like DNA-binding protein
MRQSYFTMEMHPEDTRIDAWMAALSKVSLSVRDLDPDVETFGTAVSIVSPKGVKFARIITSKQLLTFNTQTDSTIWAIAVIERGATIANAATTVSLKAGDMAFGLFDQDTSLWLENTTRIVFAQFPLSTLKARLITPEVPKLAKLETGRGIGHLLAGFFASLGETLGRLEQDEIWAIESSIIELFSSALVSKSLVEPLTASSTSATASLHRISQVIESHLANPALSPADVAEACGVSTRYLQKLFKSVGTSFGQILRTRRLERCASDIINPQYAKLSISDIGFRWGFNDASHFSRTFHEQLGVSPRQYRRSEGSQFAQKLPKQFRKGWPDGDEEIIPGDSIFRGRGFIQAQEPLHPTEQLVAKPKSPAVPCQFSNKPNHHHLAATEDTVHWGFFSRDLAPVLEIQSNDTVTIETLSHHAYDDYNLMIKGDAGAEEVFKWTSEGRRISRRGVGPDHLSGSELNSTEGSGVHICTGPIAIRDAMPGDVIELRILDIHPRSQATGELQGKSYGVNAAARWGFHYNQMLEEPKRREVITVFEMNGLSEGSNARALYSFRWKPQIDPSGRTHSTMDYPGIPVRHDTIEKNYSFLRGVSIPVRPHFGVIALAPKEANLVDSVPPAYFGGNLDNWRAAKGSSVFLPVSVPGGLLSIGDPHASQGDGEISGTAIECSLTGEFHVILHKRQKATNSLLRDLNYPLIETALEWVIHGFSFPNYLAELSKKTQSNVHQTTSLDFAMQDAFRKTRRFLMKAKGLSEDEAISLMSVAIDFGVTQVVNGNWCVHAIIRKSLFS